MKIVILDYATVGTLEDFDSFKDLGEVIGYENINNEDIPEAIKDCDVVVTNKKVLNEKNLKFAENLKQICVTATGYNNIDLEYCSSRDIPVCNVKGYSTSSVAQHTFAMLLNIYEPMSYYNDFVKEGKYADSKMFTLTNPGFHELDGKTWGIIGMGEIGRKVASIASAFGCDVIYYSTSGRNNDQPYKQVHLDTLLAKSDIISIHSPLNDSTRNLITINEFEKMEKRPYIINVARGGIINEKDMFRALDNLMIRGLASDVFEQEPMNPDYPKLPIINNPNLLFTPHVAWGSYEARERLIKGVYSNIASYSSGFVSNKVN